MSDAERRRRERAGDGGELEAAAALLQERVRAGELSEDLLALSAYLGHAPAQVALGPATPVGEFAPVPALAAALEGPRAREFWRLVVRFACGEFASRVGSIHDEVLSDLERLSAWCAAPAGPAPELGRRAEFETYWRPWMSEVPIGEVLAIFALAADLGPEAGATWWSLAPLRGREAWKPRFGPRALPILLGEAYWPEPGHEPREEDYLAERARRGRLTPALLSLAGLAGHPAAVAASGIREEDLRALTASFSWLDWEHIRRISWRTFSQGISASGRPLRSEEDAQLQIDSLRALWPGVARSASAAQVDVAAIGARLAEAAEREPKHQASLGALALSIRSVHAREREGAREALLALHRALPGDARPEVERALKRSAISAALG